MSALQAGPSRITRTLGALALGAAMALTASSSAQFGVRPGYRDLAQPSFTSRDVQLAVDMLQLDEPQRFILETLFEDYQAEFRTGRKAWSEHIREMMSSEIDPTDPSQAMRMVLGSMDDWRQESQQLAHRFIEDLKGLLSEEQVQLWPSFERRVFRLKYLNKGRLPGENLDLLSAVRQLDLDEPQMQAIQPLLDEYEQSLHEALQRRVDYVNASESELVGTGQAGDPNMRMMVAERRIALRKAVRDANEHYMAAIAAALPQEVGEHFLQTVRQRVYPRVYRPTQVHRIFAAAKEIEGLSEEVLEAIEHLEQQYLAELAVFNERLVQLVREHQPNELKRKAEIAAARAAGQQPQQTADVLGEEFRKRREMGDRYVQQLRALLAPEQFMSLPGALRWLPPDQRPAGKAGGKGSISGEGPGNLKGKQGQGATSLTGSEDQGKDAKGSKGKERSTQTGKGKMKEKKNHPGSAPPPKEKDKDKDKDAGPGR